MKSITNPTLLLVALLSSAGASASDNEATEVPEMQCVPSQQSTSSSDSEETRVESDTSPHSTSSSDTQAADQGYYLVFPNKYYISAGIGYFAPKDDEASDDPSEFATNLLFGMQIDPNWALEFNYYLNSEMKFDSTKLEYGQWELTARYDYRLTERWGLYARAGAAKWDLEKTLPDDPHFENEFSSDGWSFTGELGGTFKLSDRLHVNAGYTFTPNVGGSSTGSLFTNRIMVSATWKFGFKEHAIHMADAE
ncbi:hypothetical protein JCM19236_4792 [Vibrio sp. JCM 19236]|nr:hypothetical protein JCM19236_4792 [Vibrio sp. JCM 19236]